MKKLTVTTLLLACFAWTSYSQDTLQDKQTPKAIYQTSQTTGDTTNNKKQQTSNEKGQAETETTTTKYLDQLDQALDPSIAATLAGLAIAAATFLIAFTSSVSEKINRVKKDDGKPSQTDVSLLKKAKKAVNRLMLSFYFFVGFLIETLTVDMWEEPGSLWNNSVEATITDIVLSAGCLGIGLWLLGSGAKMIGSIVTATKTKGKIQTKNGF